MECIGDLEPKLRRKSHSSDIKGFAILSYLQIGNMGDCKECGSLVALLRGRALACDCGRMANHADCGRMSHGKPRRLRSDEVRAESNVAP
jgi:hypothetical protein